MTYKVGRCLLHDIVFQKGMTLTGVSERLNMSLSQLSAYANDHRRMSYETSINVSFVVGCHAEDLYEKIPVTPGQRKRRRHHKE